MKKLFALTVIFALAFAGCGDGNNNIDDNETIIPVEEIDWNFHPSGTVTVVNNTGKDMVLFQGQNPSINGILGGVRAYATNTFDISNKVSDFNVGGWMIIKGMTLDEYEANRNNLSQAKVKYSAVVIYGLGRQYSVEINPSQIGDYCFRVTNSGGIGIELRKNSPDGEKIGYIPALAVNYPIYANSADSIIIVPVYVFFSNITKSIVTFTSTSIADYVSVAPRPINDPNVSTVRIPSDPNILWQQIVDTITYPVAFINVANNVPNQVPNQVVKLAVGSQVRIAQNGYNFINSGEMLTFELQSTDAGQQMNLNMQMYGGTVSVPVRQGGFTPTIKNGYDYALTLSYNGSGSMSDANNYTAEITEVSKRDVLNDISSL